jgi:hypothetical protein
MQDLTGLTQQELINLAIRKGAFIAVSDTPERQAPNKSKQASSTVDTSPRTVEVKEARRAYMRDLMRRKREAAKQAIAVQAYQELQNAKFNATQVSLNSPKDEQSAIAQLALSGDVPMAVAAHLQTAPIAPAVADLDVLVAKALDTAKILRNQDKQAFKQAISTSNPRAMSRPQGKVKLPQWSVEVEFQKRPRAKTSLLPSWSAVVFESRRVVSIRSKTLDGGGKTVKPIRYGIRNFRIFESIRNASPWQISRAIPIPFAQSVIEPHTENFSRQAKDVSATQAEMMAVSPLQALANKANKPKAVEVEIRTLCTIPRWDSVIATDYQDGPFSLFPRMYQSGEVKSIQTRVSPFSSPTAPAIQEELVRLRKRANNMREFSSTPHKPDATDTTVQPVTLRSTLPLMAYNPDADTTTRYKLGHIGSYSLYPRQYATVTK